MVLSLSAFRQSSKSPSPRRRHLIRSSSSQSVLSEALRSKPFRLASTEPLPAVNAVDGVREINDALVRLAELFPDVKVEVIREILTRFDGDSRLEISAEQLYKYKAEWARGRYHAPPREIGEEVPLEELFRSKEYTTAVKKTLALEFRGVNKSAIDAVLAEVNACYSRARPILQGLAVRSWRYSITNFFKKRPQDDIPACLFVGRRIDSAHLQLVSTESSELDKELNDLFIKPLKRGAVQNLHLDFEYAQKLNQHEAEESNALFECQCCYNDVTFETMAACTANCHIVCFECIRRTVHEALFGQGWSKSVDPSRASLRCLATSVDDCPATISADLVKRAILADRAGAEMWTKYEERFAVDALHKSQLKLLHCPFCSYAEADRPLDPQTGYRHLHWRFRDLKTFSSLMAILTLLNFLPLLLCILLPLSLLLLATTSQQPKRNIFYISLAKLATRQRPTRFRCRNPSCGRKSCLKCHKAWHDPHVCHEPLLMSLRTSVEAARTAAVKRTCPRCGTSFVKASGCNKLTCTCGYSMCYLCRKNITRSSPASDGEGYRHFCEHFRPVPGRPCTECNKCDLYRNEDEDEVVRRAGEEAERLWRIREGMVGVEGLEGAVRNVGRRDQASAWERLWMEKWTVQRIVDWFVERLVVVVEDDI